MSPHAELTIWLYPTAGEPFAVTTTDFDSEEGALDALGDAIATGNPLCVHEHAGAEGRTTLVINPKNLVAARVRAAAEPADTGPYL